MEEEKIMDLSVEMGGLKRELMLTKNVADMVENGNKKNQETKKKKEKKKTRTRRPGRIMKSKRRMRLGRKCYQVLLILK